MQRFVDRLAARNHLATDSVQVRGRLEQIISERQQWQTRNRTEIEPGPGRVDALNVILNQVTAGMLGRPENARTPDAPVSYPVLWVRGETHGSGCATTAVTENRHSRSEYATIVRDGSTGYGGTGFESLSLRQFPET